MSPTLIQPLDSQSAQLENLGGKGLNLCKLSRSGFNVPPGFIISTPAYHLFLETHQLGGLIHDRVSKIQPDDPASLEFASTAIRSAFSSHVIPSQAADQILEAYRSFKGVPVAVRSSATAEDLPDLSFAGQQDTFLNIIGEHALLRAIIDCWSSLWTARVIGYRARNGIPQDGVSMAVIMQEMVSAGASGVLFTANPLTGSRLETVIDATIGLGEALVSGLVEPDHYVVNPTQNEFITKTLGDKRIAVLSKPGGGIHTQKMDISSRQALPDGQIFSLADLGRQIEDVFDFPQDIEWAWDGEQLYILQSRAITSLFPIPKGMKSEPLRIMISFASIQGIMEPFTPLGQDTIRLIFAGGSSLFGYDRTHLSQGVIKIAGERLWGDFTAIIHHPIGARVLPKIIPVIEPTLSPLIQALWDDSNLGRGRGKLRLSTFRRLAGFALPFLKRTFSYIRHPNGVVEQIYHASQVEIDRLLSMRDKITGDKTRLDDRVELYRQMYYAFPYVVPNIVPGAAAGLIPLVLLNRISKQQTGSWDLALETTRGLPNNETTQMDLDLWETARKIRANGNALQHLSHASSKDLANEYLEARLPDPAQGAIEAFLKEYGLRGLGEIDIGRPRWNEDPAHIMEVLKSYLQIEDDYYAPNVVFKRGEIAAERAIIELASTARSTFGGRLKGKFVRGAARRVRALAGLRESPKFHIVKMMWIIRQALLESGQALVSAGKLQEDDDLFYLYLDELESYAQGEKRDWGKLISERRKSFQAELSRVQFPRLLLSDGRAFYDGSMISDEEDNQLTGSPVSPGSVEGLVKVVLNPKIANLSPGEILVCPGTDPAWTPLFLAAGGLVMEVGGMMTHGAIVAREYGIPAIVGVHQATKVLKTGQRVRVDGSSGKIALLD
jgi:phosphohistidine swiveling domain-containing protein